MNPKSTLVKAHSILLSSCLSAGLFFLPFSKALSEIGFWLCIPLFLAKFLFPGQKPKTSPLFIVYGAFLLIIFVSVFLNLNTAPSGLFVRGTIKWIKYLLIFFICLDYAKDEKQVRSLFLCFLAAMTVVGLDGLYQLTTGASFISGETIDPGRILRIKSSFGGPNGLGAFLLFALPLCYTFIKIERRKWLRMVWPALFSLFVICFLFTFSRSALIGLCIAFFLFSLLKREWAAFLIMLFGTLALIAVIPGVKENLLNLLNPNDTTLNLRLHTWEMAWKLIQSKLWFGNGINSFHHHLAQIAPPDFDYRGHAHNCYLQMWSEIGIFGLLAFLIPFASLFQKNNFETAGPEQLWMNALWIGIVAALIQSFFDTNFYALQTAGMFWVFWGIWMGLRQKITRQSP